MILSPGTRLGPYEIGGALGAGGMGEVYRAKDTRLGRTVAIKVLPADLAASPERRRRFEQEARAVSALNHPHICILYDIGSAVPSDRPGAPSTDFLVMEHLDGQSVIYAASWEGHPPETFTVRTDGESHAYQFQRQLATLCVANGVK